MEAKEKAMTTENATQQAATDEQQQQPQQQPAKAKRNTAAKADEMRRELERKTRELQECLRDLQRKNELSQMRGVFIDTLDNIAAIKAELDDCAEFETKRYAVTFAVVGNYERKPVFSVSNTAILRDFIEFVTVRIERRVAEIEAEIIK